MMKLNIFPYHHAVFYMAMLFASIASAQDSIRATRQKMINELRGGGQLTVSTSYPLALYTSHLTRPSPVPLGISYSITAFRVAVSYWKAKVKGPLTYQAWGSAFEQGSIWYDYSLSNITADAMFIFKGFSVGPHVCVLSAGLGVYMTDVLPFNLDKIKWSPPANSSVRFQQLNGFTQYLVNAQLDRYIWFRNKEMLVRFKVSVPLKTKYDELSEYDDDIQHYYINKKMTPLIEISYHYDFIPTLRYNPAKMRKL